MIRANQSSHWYTQSGEPAYGSTLREARKQDLVPSVTSIIGILEKPQVTAWKVNTMLACAWNVDKCESMEEWREQVETSWQHETTVAAERGTRIHEFCQDFIEGTGERIPEFSKQCELIEEWIMENIDSATCETSFSHYVNGLGYGGRIDCHGTLRDGRPFVLDFKTQDMKGKNAPNYYPEFVWQLAAYKSWLDSMDGEDCAAMSVLIDTSDIQKIHVKEYTGEELDKGMKKFSSLLNTFYTIKDLI